MNWIAIIIRRIFGRTKSLAQILYYPEGQNYRTTEELLKAVSEGRSIAVPSQFAFLPPVPQPNLPHDTPLVRMPDGRYRIARDGETPDTLYEIPPLKHELTPAEYMARTSRGEQCPRCKYHFVNRQPDATDGKSVLACKTVRFCPHCGFDIARVEARAAVRKHMIEVANRPMRLPTAPPPDTA